MLVLKTVTGTIYRGFEIREVDDGFKVYLDDKPALEDRTFKSESDAEWYIEAFFK